MHLCVASAKGKRFLMVNRVHTLSDKKCSESNRGCEHRLKHIDLYLIYGVSWRSSRGQLGSRVCVMTYIKGAQPRATPVFLSLFLSLSQIYDIRVSHLRHSIQKESSTARSMATYTCM